MSEEGLVNELEALMKEDVRDYLKDRDINHFMASGLIIHSTLGSLLLLREFLERRPEYNLIHQTITGEKLYLVKWHDLNRAKQDNLNGKSR